MARSNFRKTALLLGELMRYVAPRGNNKIRLRIWAAFSCLVAAKSSNMVTPLLYGAAVDLVNHESGFAMSALIFLVGGYALARLGQQVFADDFIFGQDDGAFDRVFELSDIAWPRVFGDGVEGFVVEGQDR